MTNHSVLLMALLVAVSNGCAPPENPHGVAVATCDPRPAGQLYTPGAIRTVEASHALDESHSEYEVTGATLLVRSVEDVSAFEHALRCHSARYRTTAGANRAFDPLLPAKSAPEISVSQVEVGERGVVSVQVTSKNKATAEEIYARARVLLERSKQSSPGDRPDAPSGT